MEDITPKTPISEFRKLGFQPAGEVKDDALAAPHGPHALASDGFRGGRWLHGDVAACGFACERTGHGVVGKARDISSSGEEFGLGAFDEFDANDVQVSLGERARFIHRHGGDSSERLDGCTAAKEDAMSSAERDGREDGGRHGKHDGAR